MDSQHDYTTIICGNCGETHEIPTSCGNRFCPVCSSHSRSRARAKMDAIVTSTHSMRGYRWRHIVLTIPSSENPRHQVKALLSGFRRLRQRVWWKRQVAGGFFTIEITKRPAGWHAHIHCAVFSKFIYASALGQYWRDCSSGRITKIKLAPSGALIRYLVAYISKSEMEEPSQIEASKALKHLRLFGTFGTISKLALQIKLPPFICSKCGSHGWVHEREKSYAETKSYFDDVRLAAGFCPDHRLRSQCQADEARQRQTTRDSGIRLVPRRSFKAA